MEFVSKYLECLSKWQLNVAAGPQTVAALALLATGGVVVAWKTLTFIRVILSLFILPGKPVRLIPTFFFFFFSFLRVNEREGSGSDSG